ncbi:hypothetical protein [Halobaculum lipolyticum]|uniref:Uncharacterized protein n=1 Tax=Halobaculum lipolyticum TaxID=3032001 RepID=A0ABD5W6V3_9EURY|nr:hypothetical protein [Halobaculum sp. DT31]
MRRRSAVVLVWVFLCPIVASVAWNVDRRLALALVATALGGVVALAAGRVRAAVGDAASRGEGDGWSLIPNRQYEGRHAESGGIARGEQERALREIEAEAERRDREE